MPGWAPWALLGPESTSACALYGVSNLSTAVMGVPKVFDLMHVASICGYIGWEQAKDS